MLIIPQYTTNPFFNIAAEEYLLKQFDKDIFRLYLNESSVIVGKHQNAMAEANYRFVTENNLPVIRRISGGGTVFHDLGNINFTFIANGREGHLVDFKRFTQPIIEVLCKLGIDAKLEGKNDIRVNGLKISGNAEHVYKNRVLHHGTILVSANLEGLGQSLKVEEERYTDNAVKSIRSKVTNIGINSGITVDQLCELINKHIIEQQPNNSTYKLSPTDVHEIYKLAQSKYNTWEWNYAYSPDYTVNTSMKYNNEIYRVKILVSKGIIAKLELTEPNSELTGILSQLINKRHAIDALCDICYMQGLNVWELF